MVNKEKSLERERVRLRKDQNPQQVDFKRMDQKRAVKTEFWKLKKRPARIPTTVKPSKKAEKKPKAEKVEKKKDKEPELEIVEEEPEIEEIDEELEDLYSYDDETDEELDDEDESE